MSLNFDFLRECKNQDPFLQRLYDEIDEILDKAEDTYWEQPVECARFLQVIAEKVCQIYNHYYQIGLPEKAGIEEYLCYGDEEEHNRNVSLFFSAVRNEHRNQLNEIRTLGDKCIYLENHPEERAKSGDMVMIDVRQMMITTMESLKEMCKTINHCDDLSNKHFMEDILPKQEEPEEEPMKKESFWRRVWRI